MRRKDKSTNKKNYEIIYTPVPPPTPCYESTTHYLSHPPIIHNNHTMDIEFLVHIKQSNKCGSVWNNEIFNLTWDLVWALESASPASCKTPVTFIDSIRPNN